MILKNLGNADVTSNVNFDSNATTKGSATIESNVRTTITNYNTDNLNTFNGLFRHSKLVGLIDSTDPSITSNTLSVSLAKLFTPDTSQAKSYNLYYSRICMWHSFYKNQSDFCDSSHNCVFQHILILVCTF